MDAVEFWSICSVNGLVLSREQLAQIERYAGDLLYWNERVNLISRRDTEHIWLRHILHSLTIAMSGEMPATGRVLDIGTGGGLPGIPLKIALPKLDVTLLDSIAKKVQTTGMLASHISKHGIRAVRQRAEELPNDPSLKGPYDVVVSRATAPLVDLMKWSHPILKPGGKILTLKGGALTDEVEHAQSRFPNASISILDIDVKGVEWFVAEEKKLVRVTFGDEEV
ncbi:MAG: 16S rRNA (guanine(527)-N(7))-methyltransferase RsmG [bacterium]|nr:16S rRNA (guanine(527)-N(7))-methyltransferase RsmG [Candidatus Kapabacteria bacterium]